MNISISKFIFSEDRCLNLAKRKYKTFPSAYASGAIVRCRKGKIWKKLKEEIFSLSEIRFHFNETKFKKEKEEGLHGWFSRNRGKGWIDCKTGKPCGRQEGEKRSYPACRPTKKSCNKIGTRRKKGSKRVSWEKK